MLLIRIGTKLLQADADKVVRASCPIDQAVVDIVFVYCLASRETRLVAVAASSNCNRVVVLLLRHCKIRWEVNSWTDMDAKTIAREIRQLDRGLDSLSIKQLRLAKRRKEDTTERRGATSRNAKRHTNQCTNQCSNGMLFVPFRYRW